jgi:molybdenum cofactor biosynthesis protein B
MGYQEHQTRAQEEHTTVIRCAVITVSDTRTPETDTSGAIIRTMLTQTGHDVVRYEVVRDEANDLIDLVQDIASTHCQVIITTGGTGIARRDNTFEAIDGLLDKRLPGFGELFRMLSYAEIGAAAMLSRSTAGIYGTSLIFCLPGSSGAVRLALEKLIMPELSHLVWEISRQ